MPDAPCSSAAGARGGGVSRPERRRFPSLRGRGEFRRVRQQGRRCRVGGITVVAAPGGPDSPRVGILASRAVGSAVRRNRAKRRLREAAALVSLRDDRDYLVIAGEAVPAVPFSRLTEWLAKAVEELR